MLLGKINIFQFEAGKHKKMLPFSRTRLFMNSQFFLLTTFNKIYLAHFPFRNYIRIFISRRKGILAFLYCDKHTDLFNFFKFLTEDNLLTQIKISKGNIKKK